MKTVARLIFIASMVLAGLSLSAYGVALAAPGLHVSGLVHNLPLIQAGQASAVTDAPEVTETAEVPQSRDLTEKTEAPESPQTIEAPEATESADIQGDDSQGQSDNGSQGQTDNRGQGQTEKGGSNTGPGEQTGSDSGHDNAGQGGGEGYQSSGAGWTAVLIANAQAEL